ncbi:hypothetical protein V6N13_126518 [Hibiscus sabdariffa]
MERSLFNLGNSAILKSEANISLVSYPTNHGQSRSNDSTRVLSGVSTQNSTHPMNSSHSKVSADPTLMNTTNAGQIVVISDPTYQIGPAQLIPNADFDIEMSLLGEDSPIVHCENPKRQRYQHHDP